MTGAMTDQTVLDAIVWAGSELGYELRARQKEVLVKGRDVFVSLPTGSGKSLCYSVLPWTYDCLRCRSKPSSVIIVVSPLVALTGFQPCREGNVCCISWRSFKQRGQDSANTRRPVPSGLLQPRTSAETKLGETCCSLPFIRKTSLVLSWMKPIV